MIIPLLCSDPSQSDPETKDFWLNMVALTETLQRQAEQNPAASYYNVLLLRYQVSQVDGLSKGARERKRWRVQGRQGINNGWVGSAGGQATILHTVMQIRRDPALAPVHRVC